MEERELNDFVWTSHYQEYRNLRSRGLRKAALSELEKFIPIFKGQNKYDRWKYIDIVNRLARKTSDYDLYIPWNLYKAFETELHEWIRLQPDNPIPYKWSSELPLLKISLDLNPFDQETLDMYYTQLINKVRLNQHEIEFGFGYGGDPQEDLNLMEKSEQYIENISDHEKRGKVRSDILVLQSAALEMLTKRKD